MIFSVILVVTLTLANGQQAELELARTMSMEHCKQVGETYAALGPIIPPTIATKAEMQCVEVPKPGSPNNQKPKGVVM